MTMVEMHTEFALRGIEGHGSWQASIAAGAESKTVAGGDTLTTADRMALTATLAGLTALRRRCSVELYSESDYLLGGATQWFPVWEAFSRRAKHGHSQIRNEHLWGELAAVAAKHDIQWHKSRGSLASCLVGRTAGTGPDAGYIYSGAVAPWTDSLGEYREFTANEMQSEHGCFLLVEDKPEEALTNKPITARVSPFKRVLRLSRADSTKCKFCNVDVVWTKSGGKSVPLDLVGKDHRAACSGMGLRYKTKLEASNCKQALRNFLNGASLGVTA